jgi:phage terminase large subunit GpA-like protein
VSAWADEHRMLSSKASAEPGAWRTDRTPYLREIMDRLSPHDRCQRVVFMKGSQVGGTECGNNWIGYVIAHSPGPMLMVQPTVDGAKRASKQRLAPMIEATPALRERVSEARTRDSGNTMMVKEFPGGLLILTGANSAAGLRSMPIRYLFCDEVDEYPGDVDNQGDPVSLAEKRTNTFANRKVFLVSTPTVKGVSRIEKEWLASDQRRYFVPCPHCGNMDWIRWENIRWNDDDPDTAYLQCVACERPIEERHKATMLTKGEWFATAEGDRRTCGYHLSSLYAPLGWKAWGEVVRDFLGAKDDPHKFKTWINTELGEVWEERGEEVDADSLKARLEEYRADVPAGVGVLTCAVDVQGDRLECKVKGWGAQEESWLIAVHVIHGDPGTLTVWEELDTFRKQSFTNEAGRKLRIEITMIDSGGHHTDQVYRYCKARVGQRVFALKGVVGKGREIVSRASDRNRYRVKLFSVNTDAAKDQIVSRLRIKIPGPGYVHLPDWTDDEYLAQLTSEKAITKWKPRQGSVREWIKTRDRNEALDLEVYCLAGLHVLGAPIIRALPERAAALAAPVEGAAPDQPGQAAPGERPRPIYGAQPSAAGSGGWMGGWKKS